MAFKLIKIETYGMKNIENMITIDFSNITLKGKKNFYNIKAIFGLNGSGKTAIINSIELYKSLVLQKNYIITDEHHDIENRINKKVNKFYFKLYYKLEGEGVNEIYSHEILLKKEDNNVYISNEKLKILLGKTINSGEERVVYEVVEGKLICDLTSKENQWVYENTINNLYQSTLVSILVSLPIIRKLAKIKEFIPQADGIIISSFVNVLLLNDFVIYTDHEDELCMNNYNLDAHGYFNNIYNIPIETSKIWVSCQEDVIKKDEFQDYKKQVKKLENFIKIFKADLKTINIDKRIDGASYRCRKIFVYYDYEIDSEYESMGIKKLMRLHSYINEAVKGKYVFIDELDSSLNSVFLDKLLEFFMEYGKGILCFTSHNLDPINVLRRKPKSLLFLGETGKLVTWAINGNANPANYYRDGVIEDSPFNIIKYDFYNSFDVED